MKILHSQASISRNSKTVSLVVLFCSKNNKKYRSTIAVGEAAEAKVAVWNDEHSKWCGVYSLTPTQVAKLPNVNQFVHYPTTLGEAMDGIVDPQFKEEVALEVLTEEAITLAEVAELVVG